MRVLQTREPVYWLALLLCAGPTLARADGKGGGPEADSPGIDVAPFVQSIADIERRHGAVDHRLSEHFLGLGLAHRANGNTDDAASAFRQALHVNRVNKGLHHLVHVPIVDLLIESYAALGDWKAVERQHRYRYWIHRRETDAGSNDFVGAALTFAAWQTQAYDFETGVSAFRHIRDAQDALSAAIERIESDRPQYDAQLLTVLNAQALAHLNLAVHMSTTKDDPVAGGSTTGDDFSDIIARRNIIVESFIRGKEALDRVVSLTEIPASEIQHGLALANRADWDLIFDRTQASAKTYREAYEQLKSAGLSENELTTEFGSPRRMSEFSLERRENSDGELQPTDQPYVTASFDVSKTGTVRNVEVLDAHPVDDRNNIRRARTTLRATRFRPGIGGDGPIETSSTIRYVFPDETI